jgi:Rieske Fe-S protein
VKFLTLGSLLLAAANWITALASRVLHPGSHAERYIAPVSALDASGSILFRYPTEQDPCIAVRTPEGKIVAYSQVCTHLWCAVVYDKAESGLFCPCHHGVFNLEGRPVAGPPIRPLPRITIERRGDELYATAMEVG